MKKNLQIKELVKDIVSKGTISLVDNYQGSSLTDVFISVDYSSGELSLYDDEENCIISELVEAWADNTDALNDAYVLPLLRSVIAELDDEEAFSMLDLYMPFSISFIDDNVDVVEELLVITDKSTIQITDDFLEKMDKDFDAFLDKLMNE